jgi:hypothetical protein
VSRVFILIGTLALAIGAFLIYLRIAGPGQPIYVPGPTSVQTVHETKWKDRVRPVMYLVPTGTAIEFFPREALAKASKIPDAPDNTIAFGQVPPHGGKTTVFATLKPGADNVFHGGLEYRQETMPFFAIQKEFGVRGGMGTGGLVLGELYARPVRVGPVTMEIRAFGKRDDRSGADFGAAILGDMRF